MNLCKHVKIKEIGGDPCIVLADGSVNDGMILDGYNNCPVCGFPLRRPLCRRGFGRFVCPRYWGRRFLKLRKRFRGGRS